MPSVFCSFCGQISEAKTKNLFLFYYYSGRPRFGGQDLRHDGGALITDNVSKGNEVELYCCWESDYESSMENVETLKILDDDFRDRFKIEEKKLMRFE